ncbi:MAG: hypothetical protein GWM90_28700, partial [Gemmatimonadetes bacterium]|nr:hypothetical protein [Gemmatimonadota bacterium]NIQ59018.1 hypothetical protein [Gemmatimonadota bacterium]NIU79225.1 hypothetical protein [Gammaproteobacteria bacterium]NIX47906.1 hypothetical protein [Gemmatimonadota bacterium]NIY12277.1 hypothetical protein [Gemmatimonadota bacterium]
MNEPPARSLVRQLRERRVPQWTIGYLMGAWVLVEATDFLTAEFGWADWIVPALTVAIAFGTFSCITCAWFHGAAGGQRITRREAAIHVVIGASLLTAFWIRPPTAVGSTEGAAEPPMTRIAVLYFKDHTVEGELTPLAADLTEAVVHRLAQVPALDVLPLTAVEVYRDEPTSYDSIVDALRAGSLLEGSMTRLEDELVVTAQLIEAGAQVHRASWVYARPAGQWAAVVTDVADSIADAIRAAIGRQVRDLRIRSGTDVPEALALYRRARAIFYNEAMAAWRNDRRQGVGLLDEADRLLAEAERLDPGWTEPILLRIEAAETKAQLMGGAGTMDREVLETAIGHADRALALTEDSARVLERRGTLRFTLAEYTDAETARRLYAGAEADLRAATRLDDERPESWWALSQLMESQGNLEGAYHFARRAYAADSFRELTGDLLEQLVSTAANLERLDEAEHWCRTGRRLLPWSQTFAQWRLVLLASRPETGPEAIEAAWAYVDTLVATGMADRRMSWTGYGEMLV